MRPDDKRRRNLKRGGIRGDAETAARARQGKAARRAELDRVEELARGDEGAALEEIAGVLARSLLRLHRRAETSGEEPSRNLIDATREFRMTLEAVTEYRRTRGHDQEAEEFFSELDSRLAAIVDRFEPQPAVEPPPEPPSVA